jgi:hypothetical protein
MFSTCATAFVFHKALSLYGILQPLIRTAISFRISPASRELDGGFTGLRALSALDRPEGLSCLFCVIVEAIRVTLLLERFKWLFNLTPETSWQISPAKVMGLPGRKSTGRRRGR